MSDKRVRETLNMYRETSLTKKKIPLRLNHGEDDVDDPEDLENQTTAVSKNTTVWWMLQRARRSVSRKSMDNSIGKLYSERRKHVGANLQHMHATFRDDAVEAFTTVQMGYAETELVCVDSLL